jgi:hypothetical protein
MLIKCYAIRLSPGTDRLPQPNPRTDSCEESRIISPVKMMKPEITLVRAVSAGGKIGHRAARERRFAAE